MLEQLVLGSCVVVTCSGRKEGKEVTRDHLAKTPAYFLELCTVIVAKRIHDK